ncbi:MAG: hypothetical protein WAN75_25420 [Xanthobacteraceae bacterium]|jgi:hypothetical protein
MDLKLTNHGSIFLLTPVGEAAHGWIEEHIPHDATRWGKADVVGRRYVTDLVNAAVDDGMNVGG